MLEVHQASFYYGEKHILKDVNLRVSQGEIIAFIGPNGSGKSTLLRCMAGICSPQKGEVTLCGKAINKYSRKAISKQISLLPQNMDSINHISVRDLVARGRSPHQAMGWAESAKDREKIDWALNYMDLYRFKDRPLNKLSGGERQRVWIAMIIAQDTDYILLDEPVNYLDIKYQWDLLKKVSEIQKSLNKSFILVLHDINHSLSVADRVIVLKEGQIYCEGRAEEVITAALIKEVYGVCAHVCRISECPRPVIVPVA